IRKQVKEENRLHEAVQALQRQVGAFEGGVIEEIKTTVQTFYNWRANELYEYKGNAAAVTKALENLHPDSEWTHFVEMHKGLLVSDNARLKTPDDIDYENKGNPLVVTIKQGRMERKTGVLKNWNDRYYVLTPIGYLHEFKSLDDTTDPELSIFLPGSSVSEKDSHKNPHSFEIHVRNAAGLIKHEKNFTFKANSREEQQDWIDKITEVCNHPVPTGPTTLPANIVTDGVHDPSATVPATYQSEVEEAAKEAKWESVPVVLL
ncbi:hypothetical protein BC938DRAFT_478425, partial [Jimgerdemannia flammicorona]